MNVKLYIKFGVTLKDLKTVIRKALNIIQWHFNQAGIRYLFVTSTNEGTHGAGSFHYANLALDFNTVRMLDITPTVLDNIRADLGLDFDVVDEGNHIHIEYDPK